MGIYNKKSYNRVKAINRQIADIAEVYGTNSEAYRQYEKSLEMLFPKDLITTSKKGFIRIKQGRKDIAALPKEKLKLIAKTAKTRGEYNKAVKKDFAKEYGEGKPTQEQLVEFSKMKQRVKDAADDGTIKKVISDKKQGGAEIRRLTYAELNALLDEEEARERKNTEGLQSKYLQETGEEARDLTEEEFADLKAGNIFKDDIL